MRLVDVGTRLANALLRPINAQIVRRSRQTQLMAERDSLRHEIKYLQRKLAPAPAHVSSPPAEYAQVLRQDNPRLNELRERYRALQHPAHAVWTDTFIAQELDLGAFRADNAYVWQARDLNTVLSYIVTAAYARHARPEWTAALTEDGLFGAAVYEVMPGLQVSRDLLDSIWELDFLDRHLGIASRARLRILDIGAGYGRLAYRAARALPNLETYLCVDAVPESTFLAEFYLGVRSVQDQARVVPLDEIDAALAATPVDLAVNIHSFSECSLSAITWWVDLLKRYRVPHLFVVPNRDDQGGMRLLSREADGSTRDMLPALEAAGYQRIVQEPKYRDPLVQTHGVTPTRYHLFALR